MAIPPMINHNKAIFFIFDLPYRYKVIIAEMFASEAPKVL